MLISLVVAAAENNAIGKGGDLLWRLPKDMQLFRENTMGRHVLMGRITYESIPEKYRPLAGRINIVVTRQPNYNAPGCKVVATIEEGIKFAEESDEEELMVIGGAEIYRQVFDRAKRIYLTRVLHRFEDADAFFPEIIESKWHAAKSEKFPADERHRYAFEYKVLDRI